MPALEVVAVVAVGGALAWAGALGVAVAVRTVLIARRLNARRPRRRVISPSARQRRAA